MKIFLSVILTALLAFVAGLFLPWWGIAIAAFLVALLIPLGGGRAFVAGFAGIFILWAVLAWWIDMKNQGILSAKIAELFPLGGSSILLILVTAFVGALVGGFAAMTAGFLRSRR